MLYSLLYQFFQRDTPDKTVNINRGGPLNETVGITRKEREFLAIQSGQEMTVSCAPLTPMNIWPKNSSCQSAIFPSNIR